MTVCYKMRQPLLQMLYLLFYYKMRQVFYYKMRQLLQNATRLLQIATVQHLKGNAENIEELVLKCPDKIHQ